jgi:membrane-bound lytic murein transglycosylase A
MKTSLPLVVLVFGTMLILPGCPQKTAPGVDALGADYERKLPDGQLALRKITDPAMVPDFTPGLADLAGLREATLLSLDYLAKPSSRGAFPYGNISHQHAVDSLQAFLAILDSGATPQQMNAAIRQRFDTYVSVGCDGKGTVLFTGYYTPIFEASPVRTERFRYPLYKMPPGISKDADGKPLTKMPDRRTIEQTNAYAGNELVWLADPFEVYVVQVQGSSRLRYPDGQEVTVGYSGNNGYDYKSIRDEMVKEGKIEKYAGLQAMIDYFRAHPGEVQTYTWRNERYVFFTFVADGQPRGSIGQPVTTMRTIATDKKIFPRACLAFLATKLPQRGPGGMQTVDYRGFALDQDTGGGIRAAGRCDVYMGTGPDAGARAGATKEEGRLYYLFLKQPASPQLVPTGSETNR